MFCRRTERPRTTLGQDSSLSTYLRRSDLTDEGLTHVAEPSHDVVSDKQQGDGGASHMPSLQDVVGTGDGK